MRLMANIIRISRAKFHYNRLTAVQYILDYASLIFWDTVYMKIMDSSFLCSSLLNAAVNKINQLQSRNSSADWISERYRLLYNFTIPI